MALIMPQDAYRFRVLFPETPQDQFLPIIQSVEDVTVDLINKKVTLVIRQSIEREVLEAVNYIVDHNASPEIEFLNHDHGVNFAATFYGMKLESHNFKASYADSKYLKHVLVWSFRSMNARKNSSLAKPADVKEPDPFFPTPAVAVAEYQKKQDDTPAPSV